MLTLDQSIVDNRPARPRVAAGAPLCPVLADVAQPAEHLFCKQVVRGSSPLVSSSFIPARPPPPESSPGVNPRTPNAARFAACGRASLAFELRTGAVLGLASVAGRGDFRSVSEGCPSGQREQTVNLPAHAFVGSNPTPSTRAQRSFGSSNAVVTMGAKWPIRSEGAKDGPQAGVAQLVERQPSKLNVEGSSPFSRSKRPTTHRLTDLPT
jgi:hypothetical protein